MVQIAKCRACGNGKLLKILDLGEQALTGRFPAKNEPDPPTAPLQLWVCDTTAGNDACGLVQLSHTCELGEMYGPTYGYRSSITRTMVTHLHDIVDRLLATIEPQSKDWLLEIGSNDGTMQRYLAGRGFNLIAIDPSAGKFAASYPAESQLIVDFFSAPAVQKVCQSNRFKAIVSIAMFYDIDQPLEFMRDVRQLLARDGIWCFEQSYLPSMMSSLCYDTICHEHLCYYGLSQIDWMAKRAGLRIIDVVTSDMDINGGSFLVTACRDDGPYPADASKISRMLGAERRMDLTSAATWEEFARRVRFHRARVRGFLEDARAKGDLVLGLGASTKGNVILQYAGIDSSLIPFIGERDLQKIGLRTPVTGIPIISEEDARRMTPNYFFVFPWHFRNEILSRESAYLESGGRFVFPLPKFAVIDETTSRGAAAATSGHAPFIPWAEPTIFGDERVLIAEAIDSTMISGGPFVEMVERELATMHECKCDVVTTSNGTTALQLAYLALGIGPGDEVIVPAWGFLAAANIALAIGATPVFADVGEDDWLLTPEEVARLIGPKTKAVVAVHTYGNVCDVTALARIAREKGVALVEDCAESFGSRRDGRMCGTFGDAGTFSFQATKTITCGEGGAVLFRDPQCAERARLIRNHGMKGQRRYWHYAVGHNFRLSNVHGAFLLAQLGHFPEASRARRALHEGYVRRLRDVPTLHFQHFPPGVDSIVWATGIRLQGCEETTRDRIIDRMRDAGIECRPGFYPPSAQALYGTPPVGISEAIANQILVPPILTRLTEEELDFVCDTLVKEIEAARRAAHVG
jgi:NDP-4-keto-2,6-dideoxyhexose 3-C-methyltransferase